MSVSLTWDSNFNILGRKWSAIAVLCRITCVTWYRRSLGAFQSRTPHSEQRQESQIIDLCTIHHSKPLGSTDHVGPKSIIKEKVWVHIVPPPMVGSLCVLPLLDNPMEGVLGNLENPPQCFFKQKQRGRLPCKSMGNFPNLTTECAPAC